MLKIKNSRSPLYLNIKKAIFTGFCMLMTAFLSGCKDNKGENIALYDENNKEIEITSNNDIKEDKQEVEEIVIEESQEEDIIKYQIKDIIGIKVYNPEKEKEEYYFFYNDLLNFDEQEYGKAYFKDTELEQYLDSDNTKVLNSFDEKVSVLDDKATFKFSSSSVIYDDKENEYSLWGYFDTYDLRVGKNTFHSTFSIVSDKKEDYTSLSLSYCNIESECYWNYEGTLIYGPNIFTLESLGYNADGFITAKELKEIQENGFQNEKVNELQLKR